MSDRHPGEQALAALDRALARKPHADAPALAEATQGLARFREILIGARREPPSEAERSRLADVNAVLSVVLAAHFPLGEIPWPEMEAARASLAGILEQDEMRSG